MGKIDTDQLAEGTSVPLTVEFEYPLGPEENPDMVASFTAAWLIDSGCAPSSAYAAAAAVAKAWEEMKVIQIQRERMERNRPGLVLAGAGLVPAQRH